MTNYFVKLNGIYDIISAFLLLFRTELSPHILLLYHKKEWDDVSIRFLAYWIFTYGMIRIIEPKGSMLIRLSYCIEALFVANEAFVKHTMKQMNAFFVIITSLFLAVFV